MMTQTAHAGDAVRSIPIFRSYFPFATLKCVGRPLYRSRVARDYACLLDLEPQVISWRCEIAPVCGDQGYDEPFEHYVDFEVDLASEKVVVEITEEGCATPAWVEAAVARQGFRYQAVRASEFSSHPRLQNARDLLRYAGYEAPLGDRIRILMALEEFGSLSLAECLSAIRDGRPMQSVAAMIFKGFIEVDLDDGLLSPDTVVRRVFR